MKFIPLKNLVTSNFINRLWYLNKVLQKFWRMDGSSILLIYIRSWQVWRRITSAGAFWKVWSWDSFHLVAKEDNLKIKNLITGLYFPQTSILLKDNQLLVYNKRNLNALCFQIFFTLTAGKRERESFPNQYHIILFKDNQSTHFTSNFFTLTGQFWFYMREREFQNRYPIQR